MTLSIVIVNYNTPSITIDCLESIIKNTIIDYEIILVDNAPKEDYREKIISIYPSKINYIKSDENIGFGRANNLGIKISQGKYVLLLNSDTIIRYGAIDECCNYLDNHPKIGLLGCKLLNSDESFQGSFYPYPSKNIWYYIKSNNWLLHKLFQVSKDYKEVKEPTEVGDISGAFMLFNASVIKETGEGFDPDFFLYCEDTEWCRNRLLGNYSICYYPKVSIIHLGGQSAPRYELQGQFLVSLGLFWYKVGFISYLSFILFHFINVITNLPILIIGSRSTKRDLLLYQSTLIKVIPYFFFHIPSSKRTFGARTEPLIYKPARKIFFPN